MMKTERKGAVEGQVPEVKTVLDFWPKLKSLLTEEGKKKCLGRVIAAEKRIKDVGITPPVAWCLYPDGKFDFKSFSPGEKPNFDDIFLVCPELEKKYIVAREVPLDTEHTVNILFPIHNPGDLVLDDRVYTFEKAEVPCIDENGKIHLLPKNVLNAGVGAKYFFDGITGVKVTGLSEDMTMITVETLEKPVGHLFL
jgi:hypothetical protein